MGPDQPAALATPAGASGRPPPWRQGEGRRIAGRVFARFSNGMRPLAVGTAVVVALSAPIADFLLERHDLVRRSSARAAKLARGWVAGGGGVAARGALPLSRGGAGARRIGEEGEAQGDVVAVELLDSAGAVISGAPARPAPWPSIEARAPLPSGGSLRVVMAEREWLPRDLLLFAVFSALGLVLGLALYLFPSRLLREQDLASAFAFSEVAAAEEERRRLSRELHDGLGQTLGAIAVTLARARAAGGGGEELAQAARLTDDALAELRRAIEDLRPPALEDLGLSGAVEALARLAERAGLPVEVAIGPLPPLDPALEQAAFRLAQEAIANAVRHSGAGSLSVALAASAEGIRLSVEDDGRGFSPGGRWGRGLAGARERAERAGGELRVTSSPGKGTKFIARLPTGAGG